MSWRHEAFGPRVLAFTITLMTLSSVTLAFESFDFDQRYFIQPGFIIKDHSVVELNGTFHLFYIKADETLPEGARAKALGHATSTDLTHWDFHPDVIPVVPNTWEEFFVWAPHVVKRQGTYYMFYTGVNRFYAQAIGVATSTDLFNWTKSSANPVYIPDTSWASWDPLSWSNCRDPFVFRDKGKWHMLTTVWTSNFKGAISHATSTDLENWTDEGPLFVHPGPNGWHVLESPNLHKVNGAYHLFFTEQNVGGTNHVASPELLGPWSYEDRVPFDPGHAVELLQVGSTWLLSRHDAFSFVGAPVYVIKFDTLTWDTQGPPSLVPVSPLDEWTIVSGTAFDSQPTFWDNSTARGAEPANLGGNSWIGTFEAYTGPVQLGEPGDSVGNEPTGVLRSRSFRLKGDRISFRIGGGNDLDHLHLSLYNERTGALLRRATGNNLETMIDVVWDVSPWKGRRVYLEIVDAATGDWGHINVDEIREYKSEVLAKQQGAKVVTHTLLHANSPNPFNPTTVIRFDLPRAARTSLKIFDVQGRHVRTLFEETLSAGRHRTLWDGRTAGGQPVASGVYFYRLQHGGDAPQTRSMALLK